ncbi:Alpha/Beta hydrolase protein [Pisolithus thermaeus]|nr:Alpha/Beta hydrolase protein [Pisolithus croceorrhizus]KAI6163590.1 Alpha/Beta hydrolase protein [Pisolithus thermaeus]
MTTLTGTFEIAGDVEFFYEESGLSGLDPTNYTTVVFIHGMGFNGAVFRRLFPFGAEHNYRIVSLYRRGYGLSTPWSGKELDLLQSSDKEDHKEYLRLAGVQVVRFLLTFVASQSIPRYAKEQKTGGLILIGWSIGGGYSNAALANLDALATEELRDLESYLHTVIYYDMSLVAMGLQSPRPYQSFLFAPTVEERWEIFKQWISSFFAHPNVYSRDSSDLELVHPRQDKLGSLYGLTDEEVAEITAPQMYATHDAATLVIKPEVFADLARRALFDKQYASRYLPDLKVRFVCGTESSGLFVHVVNEIRRCMDSGPSAVFGERAERARDLDGAYLERGNHFVFLDEPQWALAQFKAVAER